MKGSIYSVIIRELWHEHPMLRRTSNSAAVLRDQNSSGLPVPHYKLWRTTHLFSFCLRVFSDNTVIDLPGARKFQKCWVINAPREEPWAIGGQRWDVTASYLFGRHFWVAFYPVLRGLADLTHHLQQKFVNAPVCHSLTLPGISCQIFLRASPCVCNVLGKIQTKKCLDLTLFWKLSAPFILKHSAYTDSAFIGLIVKTFFR